MFGAAGEAMKSVVIIIVVAVACGILGGKFIPQAHGSVESEVALLAMADYEIPVSECWKDIGGWKSYICEVEIDHPQLGDLWCFTVEKWDGKKPTEVLRSSSGYDCDFEAVEDTLQNRY